MFSLFWNIIAVPRFSCPRYVDFQDSDILAMCLDMSKLFLDFDVVMFQERFATCDDMSKLLSCPRKSF